MNPRVEAIITAQNRSKAGFDGAVKDANSAASSIEAAGDRANNAVVRHGTAVATLGRSSAAAAAQQRNLVFQLNDTAVSLAGGMNPLMVFAQQGSQIATIYGAEEGGIGKALSETGKLAVGLVTKFWPITAAVGLGTTALAGMTAEINKAGEQQVSFGDVAMATWDAFTEVIYDMVQPAISAVGGWLGAMWDDARPVLVGLGNNIIGVFVGAFDASQAIWANFPAIMGDIAITTANNVIGGIESMINGAIGLLNDFTTFADETFGTGFGDLGEVDFTGLENPFAGATGGLGDDIENAFAISMDTDYLGKAFEVIAGKAKDLAATREEAEGVGKALGEVNKTIDPLAARMEELSGVLTQTHDPFEQMKLDLTDLKTLWDEGRISTEQYYQAVSRTTLNTASTTLGMVGQLTGAFAGLFEDNKAFAVANAVVNTAEGVTKALAQGGMFGFVSAAAVAAAGAAQIATILSAKPGSASTPTVSGGGAVDASTGAAGQTGSQGGVINLYGESFGRQQINDLVGQLNEQLGMQGKEIVVRYRGAA